MRIQTTAILALILAIGCDTLDSGFIPDAEIKTDPSILVMGIGETKTVTTEAFLGGQPESVKWNVGFVGDGLDVVEDTSYGTIYVGGELVLPAESHSRRFEVTMHDSVATEFVISGGTGTVTIPVKPPVPSP